MIKVGIVGCGTIGSEIAKACVGTLKDKICLSGICDIDASKAEALKRDLGLKCAVLPVDKLIASSDMIAEAASAKISADVLEKCIAAKKSALIMSVGGLLGREDLLGRAEAAGVKVYLPSGAICGIDALKSASTGRIDSVTITTRKNPRGLKGAPYVTEKGIDLDSLKKETVIFEGSANEAVKGFPANINVCAVLSLAGMGGAKTRVRIIADPSSDKNIHEVEVTGESGRIVTRTENVPSKANPKTSALAIMSAIATLREITKTVHIGT